MAQRFLAVLFALLCVLCVKFSFFDVLVKFHYSYQILTRSAGVKYNFSPSFT